MATRTMNYEMNIGRAYIRSYAMGDITHYSGCWQDPKHHACALREIERLREKSEKDDRLIYAETEKTYLAEKEIERLRQRLAERLIDYCVCNNCNSPTDGCNCVACTTKRLEAEIERFRKELEGADRVANSFAQTACLRSARMQVMREWMLDRELNGCDAAIAWWAFVEEQPEAGGWFDDEGVPR